jgi:hypothetical protein
MLETFIFVSGYVYGFQKYDLQKDDNLKELVSKKGKRLIFPCIVFSILYAQLINGNNLLSGANIESNLISIFSGVGHMWYLPVLFWCFTAIFFINKIKTTFNLILPAFALLAILPLPYLPFQLGRLPYYFFFFYLGQVFWLNRCKFLSTFTLQRILSIWLLFLIVFIGLRILKANVMDVAEGNIPFVQKVVFNIISKACQLTYAFLGLTAIFATGLHVTSKHKLSKWYISLGDLCFGVYIFQEFILKYLYYFSELPKNCPPHVIPWVGFTITIVFSLCLSKATKNL